MRFKGKSVLITGASSGIGAATAEAFAMEGANVVLVGRDKSRISSVKDKVLEKSNIKCEYYICDISDFEQVRKLKERVLRDFNGIDVLFNNAGVFHTYNLEGMNNEIWHESFAVNVDGAMYMTRCFIDTLKNNKGCIVNNASVSGMDSFVKGSKTYIYGSTKAALIKFSKLCALNYAEDVRVNVVCPGIIDTEIYTNRDFSRFLVDIPMNMVGMPDAVANTVLFLASEEAYYITGAVIPVDGGMALK